MRTSAHLHSSGRWLGQNKEPVGSIVEQIELPKKIHGSHNTKALVFIENIQASSLKLLQGEASWAEAVSVNSWFLQAEK